jgi:plastocyanin
MRQRLFFPCLAGLGLVGLLLALSPARAQGWGTVKGRIVWGPDKIPEPQKIDVSKNRDAAYCTKDGPVLREEKVIDPKTRGVRWVIVWLADVEDYKAAPPIHPDLKDVKPQTHEFDQPGCAFIPHVMAIRGGDTVISKNSAKVAHNVKVEGGLFGPQLNRVIQPGQTLTFENIKARRIPIIVSCTIHPWMKAYVKVFDHPYFAVTDKEGNFEIKNAPAGKYRLIAWEESEGYVLGEPDEKHKGIVIDIKANATTDVGGLKMVPSE